MEISFAAIDNVFGLKHLSLNFEDKKLEDRLDNAQKSSFSKYTYLLKDCLTHNVRYAVEKQGGYDNMVFDKKYQDCIRTEITFKTNIKRKYIHGGDFCVYPCFILTIYPDLHLFESVILSFYNSKFDKNEDFKNFVGIYHFDTKTGDFGLSRFTEKNRHNYNYSDHKQERKSLRILYELKKTNNSELINKFKEMSILKDEIEDNEIEYRGIGSDLFIKTGIDGYEENELLSLLYKNILNLDF